MAVQACRSNNYEDLQFVGDRNMRDFRQPCDMQDASI